MLVILLVPWREATTSVIFLFFAMRIFLGLGGIDIICVTYDHAFANDMKQKFIFSVPTPRRRVVKGLVYVRRRDER